MDDMRGRYRVPRRDYDLPPPSRPHVDESLRHAYRPPPPAQPKSSTHVPPVEQPAVNHRQLAPTQHHTQPKKRRWTKIFLSLVILVGLAGASWWYYPKFFNQNPFPANIQTNASNLGVSLFYPKRLPAGYKVDKSTFRINNGAIIFAANNGEPRLVFTIQKTPSSLDFGTFYKDQFKNRQQFDTAYGTVVVGKNQDRYLGSLVSTNTWLILSTNSTSISSDNLSLVLHNLKRY
ncbi:hypothetical protein KW801_01420 [Candidatus Saccharibacteria bacterium]|nr:hypothetical protein [Candidatus Saccharibacteria bacterium]